LPFTWLARDKNGVASRLVFIDLEKIMQRCEGSTGSPSFTARDACRTVWTDELFLECPSLVAQRVDGIEAGRLQRGEEAKDNPYDGADAEGHDDGAGRDERGKLEKLGEQRRQPVTRRDAQRTATHAQQDRLGQELSHYIAAARADGEADADLAGPLGDADQHDVHDANAAHHERDAGEEADQDRHDAVVGIEEVGCFLLRADHEIILLALGDLMALTE